MIPFKSSILCLALAATAAAAQENRLYILQDSTGQSFGNRIQVDQSLASRSAVGGLGPDLRPSAGPGNPLVQIGQGNAADITIAGAGGLFGAGGAVGLQQGALGAPTIGNAAIVTLNADGAQAGIQQLNDGNLATVTITSADGLGVVRQSGPAVAPSAGGGNVGTVTLRDGAISGTLIQQGSGNTTNLDVSGAGTQATYTVIGDNLSPVVDPQVFSNGGTVIVTQTLLGTARN